MNSDLTIQLLPVPPQPHRGGQLEAFHLVHAAAHWLVTPAVALLGIWMLCLALSLAAWLAWAVVWMLRWPLRGKRPDPPPKAREAP